MNKKIEALGMQIREGYGWFIHYGSKSLCRISLDTHKVEYISYVGSEGGMDNPLYTGLCFFDDKAVLLPAYQAGAMRIGMLDLKTKKHLQIPLLQKEIPEEAMQWCGFNFYGYHYNNSIFLMGRTYPAIIKYNIENGTLDYYSDYVDLLADKEKNGLHCPINGKAELIDDYLYFPSHLSKGIFKMDCRSGETEYIPLNIRAEGLLDLYKIDEERLVATCCGKNANFIVIWNYCKKKTECEMPIPIFSDGSDSWCGVACKENIVYLFSRYTFDSAGKRVFRMNKLDTKTMELEDSSDLLIDYSPAKEAKDALTDVTYVGWKDESTLLFVTSGDAVWHEYNIHTGRYQSYLPKLDANLIKTIYEDRINSGKESIVISEEDLGIEDFLEICK